MQPISRTRRTRGLVAAVAAASIITVGALAAAPPAAASTVTLSGVQANGTVGVPQNLTITAAIDGAPCGSVLAPTAQVFGSVTGPQSLIGTASFQTCVGSTYQYTYQWIPTAAGAVYISATVSGNPSNSIRSAIAAVPATTTVNAPGTVQLGVPTTISATVTAGLGAVYSPQGTVQFSILGGGNIGGPVALNQATPSVAAVSWTPAVAGGVNIIATYTPLGSGTPNQSAVCGTSGTPSCTSAPDNVQVTTSGVNVYIANPPSLAAGIPSTLTAVVSVTPPSGTVTFLVNGSSIGTAPVQSNGYATVNWTPPAAGSYGLTVNWAGSGGLKGSATETLSVGATPAQSDQIIIVSGNGTTLTPGQTYNVPNGTVISFSSSTASGSPVTFSVTGPCSISANTFTASQGNGQCRVTASSPGGNGYGPATATAVANLVPGTQTAKLAAPASGNVNVGKTVTLAKKNQVKTNAGQTISWKITSGKGSICNLSFPSDGSVKLKIVKKGTCKVQANAKAVSGQWNAYQQNWKYKGV